MHLDSSSGFNGFQNMAICRTSKLSSRTVLVGEGYSKFSQFPCFLHCLDHWACSPAPSSVLNASLKPELLQASLHALALPEPQPAPAGSTFLLFCFGRLVLLELLLLLTAPKLLIRSPWSSQLLIARPGYTLGFCTLEALLKFAFLPVLN